MTDPGDHDQTIWVFTIAGIRTTQRVKRQRLARPGVEVPKALEFVPIDFECESLRDALTRSSFSPERRSFHSLDGNRRLSHR
jgi:hypothetical protein